MRDTVFVNVPFPDDLGPTQSACSRTCFGQTQSGKDSQQEWHVLGYEQDTAHMMFLGVVDLTECDFLAAPVVSVSLAANNPNQR